MLANPIFASCVDDYWRFATRNNVRMSGGDRLLYDGRVEPVLLLNVDLTKREIVAITSTNGDPRTSGQL
ncbi:hypothetical protein ACVWZZ_000254 [Bradyrhizobium sp. LM6.10]